MDDFAKEILQYVANHNGEWTKRKLREQMTALNPAQARLVPVAIVALEVGGYVELRHGPQSSEPKYWLTPAGRQALDG